MLLVSVYYAGTKYGFVQVDGGHAGLLAAGQGARPLHLLRQGFKVAFLSVMFYKLLILWSHRAKYGHLRFVVLISSNMLKPTCLKKVIFVCQAKC